MALPRPSREAVLQAISEFDDLGREEFLSRHGFKHAKWWFLVHDGRLYDTKAIYGVAVGIANNQPRAFREFSGGEQTVVRQLRNLGFEVRNSPEGRGDEAGTDEVADRQAWIFQSNPHLYDIARAVRTLKEMNWTVAQGKNLIHPGHHLYIWQSGPQGGVIAEGTVLTDPEMLPSQEGEEFIRDEAKFEGEQLRVRLSIDRVLEEPLSRTMLKEHQVLENLEILRFANATNFRVTPEQDAALQALIAGEPGAQPRKTPKVWWVNQGQTFGEEREGGFLWAPKKNRAGRTQAHWDSLLDVREGDISLSYVDGQIRAVAEVQEAAADSPPPSEHFSAWDRDGRRLNVDYRELDAAIPLSDIPQEWRVREEGPFDRAGGVKQGYLFPLSDQFVTQLAGRFPELGLEQTMSPPVNRLTVDELKATAEALPFNLRLEDGLYASLVAALESGKHVVLTGPPGTAKTTLAQAVSETAKRLGLCHGYLLTTATADWTTYETIGGLRPVGGDRLEFSPGHFLQAIEDQNWLVIDELNRSQFDRAFGQLFTVLSGQAVTLPYARPGAATHLTLLPQGADPPTSNADVLRVPSDWRIVATMNVFDKSLLFEMSYALMRRFAFIEVPSPDDDVFRALISEAANGEPSAIEVASALLPIRRIKDVGPAVYQDIARFSAEMVATNGASGNDVKYQAFYSYLLPQFEGISDEQGEVLLATLSEICGISRREEIRETLCQVLGVELDAAGTATGTAVPGEVEPA